MSRNAKSHIMFTQLRQTCFEADTMGVPPPPPISSYPAPRFPARHKQKSLLKSKPPLGLLKQMKNAVTFATASKPKNQ